MFERRAAEERGHYNHGWLDTRHTFSFGSYFDKRHMGFRSLRVINEDIINPGGGFGMHPHRNMEIITYIISGALEHKDSLGNSGVLRPGMIQRMSAGSGIVHSEFNHSADEAVHLLQIWIEPAIREIDPSYEDLKFDLAGNRGRLVNLAGSGVAGAAHINQDAALHAARLDADSDITLPLSGQRYGWLQVVTGGGEIGGMRLNQGDGLAISRETEPRFRSIGESEILLFDLG